MSLRMKYETKVAEQLTAWSAQLDTMKTRTDDALKAGLDSALAEWKAALLKLEELKASVGGRWGAIKVEMEAACRGVEASLGRIMPGEPAPVPPVDVDASTRITDRSIPIVIPDGEPPSAA
jgi:hypothetical protein